jgi:hypothetical protein
VIRKIGRPIDVFLWKASFCRRLTLSLQAGYKVVGQPSRCTVKKISEQQRIGQQGVHLLGARLLSVGLSFHPNGPLDAGIDGFLELRDPETGEVRAQWITAQLKTQKEGRFTEETDESFSYLCRQEDLDYWLSSNVPVVLFLARLSDERIVWKSLHTWFADAEHRRTRKVIFDKTNDALNETALPGLAATVSNFSAPGRVVPSTRMRDEVERVYSTLVTRVHRKPKTAPTDELPVFIGAADFPVFKRDRSTIPDVFCNGGLHVHVLVLIPPASRLKGSLADHLDEKRDLYVGSGTSIQRIHVEPVIRDEARVVDYVFKTIRNGRLSYDEAVIVLPRARTELGAT